MVLTEGFRDSPHLFGQALQQNLNSFNLFPSKLIQYVDDLFYVDPQNTYLRPPPLFSLIHEHIGDIEY
jgi:hypothetical protein